MQVLEASPPSPAPAPIAPSPPAPLPMTDAERREHEKLRAQIAAIARLKRGVERVDSVVGATVATYEKILDGAIWDVAIDLHRTLSLGLETLDSVQERVPPTDAASIAHDLLARDAGANAEACAMQGMGPRPINIQPPSGKVGKGTKDIYGRTGGVSKQATECPLCVQKVAAARFAQHLERCMGKGRTSARQPPRVYGAPVQPPRGGAGAGAGSGPSIGATHPAMRSNAMRAAGSGGVDLTGDDVPLAVLLAAGGGKKKGKKPAAAAAGGGGVAVAAGAAGSTPRTGSFGNLEAG